MAMIMNGKSSFLHPVTQVLIGPFEFYEGIAHTEHESTLPLWDSNETDVSEQDQETVEIPKGLLTSAKRYSIEVTDKSMDELKAAVQEAAQLEKETKQKAAEAAGGNGEAK